MRIMLTTISRKLRLFISALLLYFFCNLSESLILVWLFIKTITRGIKGEKKTGHDIEQRNREKSSTFSHELEVETIYIVMLRLE